MRKSVTAFVCGLIGSLFSLWWGFMFGVIGNVGTLITAGTSTGVNGTVSALYWLGWLCFIGAIFGIVGSANCFKKARAGAIWLTIATVMCGALQIYVFATVTDVVSELLLTRIFIFLLPVVLLAVATVFAWLAKKVEHVEGKTNSINHVQVDDNNASLEKELLKLKSAFENGLITEDEYKAARQKIIEKYM